MHARLAGQQDIDIRPELEGTAMYDRIHKRLEGDRQAGFTLIELLIVIVILGILAAIVVFAVGGITDRGQDSACKSDLKTLETAEEAYFAQAAPAGSKYVAESALVPTFLHQESDMYNVTVTGGGTGFTV